MKWLVMNKIKARESFFLFWEEDAKKWVQMEQATFYDTKSIEKLMADGRWISLSDDEVKTVKARVSASTKSSTKS